MTLPVSTNSYTNPKDTCGSPVSSKCVIWQGPDIPCIDLCKGDSIDQVVYKLATLLCEISEGVLDITTLDFKCLVEEGQENPQTLLQTVQLLINKTCNIEENCCSNNPGGGGGSTPTPIALPECLWYEEDGDQITQLLPDQYSQYLAEKICLLITGISSLQSAIITLNTRLTNVENIVGNGGGGGGTGNITITTGCVTGTAPGETLSIQTAFQQFETRFCQLQALLGSDAALNAAISKECTNLDTANQLSNSEDTMSELSGWVASPTTLSATIVNLWLTLCDMRTAIVSLQSAGPPDCAVLPPYNVQITNLTTTGCTVKWNLPPTGAYANPTSFVITVKQWDGTAAVGMAIATQTVAYPNIQYVFSNIGEANKFYIVEVSAVYSCGESVKVSAIGNVRISPIAYQLKVEEETTTNVITTLCDGVNQPAVEKRTTITLINPATGLPIVNNSSNINVTLRYSVTGNCVAAATENVTLTILSGQSTGTYTYISRRYVKCGTNPCTEEFKNFLCGVSTGNAAIAFHPSVTNC